MFARRVGLSFSGEVARTTSTKQRLWRRRRGSTAALGRRRDTSFARETLGWDRCVCAQVGLSFSGGVARTTSNGFVITGRCWVGIDVFARRLVYRFRARSPELPVRNSDCGGGDGVVRPPSAVDATRHLRGRCWVGIDVFARRLVYRFRARSPELPVRNSDCGGGDGVVRPPSAVDGTRSFAREMLGSMCNTVRDLKPSQQNSKISHCAEALDVLYSAP